MVLSGRLVGGQEKPFKVRSDLEGFSPDRPKACLVSGSSRLVSWPSQGLPLDRSKGQGNSHGHWLRGPSVSKGLGKNNSKGITRDFSKGFNKDLGKDFRKPLSKGLRKESQGP